MSQLYPAFVLTPSSKFYKLALTLLSYQTRHLYSPSPLWYCNHCSPICTHCYSATSNLDSWLKSWFKLGHAENSIPPECKPQAWTGAMVWSPTDTNLDVLITASLLTVTSVYYSVCACPVLSCLYTYCVQYMIWFPGSCAYCSKKKINKK